MTAAVAAAPVLIMVAPTGARRSKDDHPALPITTAEIAETAAECLAAGAGAIHVHVRDAAGRHSLDAAAYRDAFAAVKARCGERMAIQATTESAGVFTPPDQDAALRALIPGAASIAPRELFSGDAERARATLAFAAEAGIALQYILYDDADIERFAALRSAGIFPGATPRIILVLGRYGAGYDSRVEDLAERHAALERTGLAGTTVWTVCAFGRGEIACLEAAMRLGGHVRVGFENAIVDAEGRLAGSNAERVAIVAAAARRLGREPLFGAEARAVLGIA